MFSHQGKIQKFIPTTICGVSVLLAALLVLLQPETKDKHLTDHVDDEEQTDTNEAIELQKSWKDSFHLFLNFIYERRVYNKIITRFPNKTKST